MKTLSILTAFALSLAAAPVMAQTTAPATPAAPTPMIKSAADCQANWKLADKNGDGKLDQAEISANKALMPTTVASNATVTQQEFLSACSAAVPAKR